MPARKRRGPAVYRLRFTDIESVFADFAVPHRGIRPHGGMERRVLAVLFYEEVGAAPDAKVGGHVRGFGAVMFGSVCLRDRNTGILLRVLSGCRLASFFGRLRRLPIYRCRRLSATSRTGDDFPSQVIILCRALRADVLQPTVRCVHIFGFLN